MMIQGIVQPFPIVLTINDYCKFKQQSNSICICNISPQSYYTQGLNFGKHRPRAKCRNSDGWLQKCCSTGSARWPHHQLAEGSVMCKSFSQKQAADSVSKHQEWMAEACSSETSHILAEPFLKWKSCNIVKVCLSPSAQNVSFTHPCSRDLLPKCFKSYIGIQGVTPKT